MKIFSAVNFPTGTTTSLSLDRANDVLLGTTQWDSRRPENTRRRTRARVAVLVRENPRGDRFLAVDEGTKGDRVSADTRENGEKNGSPVT